MRYSFFLLSFLLFMVSGPLTAQVSMGFENLSTTQTCNSTTCNYRDFISASSAHDLVDDVDMMASRNIPVNSPSSSSVLGFTSRFRPTRTGGSVTGLNDGDFFGYAGSVTIQNNVGATPTEGSQAFIAEDTDGEVTLNFSPVYLMGTGGGNFSMDYIVDGGFEFSDGADDLLKIELDITDCAAATNITLLNATGSGAPGTTGLNSITSQTWMTVNQDLSSFSACAVTLKVTMDANSSTEEFALDNIVFTTGTALPVEFSSIAASQENDAVMLDWSTASETDNRGFSVERSTDGRTFSAIGWVDGNGESGREINYVYKDENVRSGQAYFYRLRQEDFDGAFDYSAIVSIILKGTLSDEQVGQVFPNPTLAGQSNIVLNPAEPGHWTLTVFDANGRKVAESSHQLSAGKHQLPVDLSRHPVGTYLVILTGNGSTTQRKLIN